MSLPITSLKCPECGAKPKWGWSSAYCPNGCDQKKKNSPAGKQKKYYLGLNRKRNLNDVIDISGVMSSDLEKVKKWYKTQHRTDIWGVVVESGTEVIDVSAHVENSFHFNGKVRLVELIRRGAP